MNKEFFFCYDFKLKKHLANKKFKHVTHARNINSGREFWLYVINSELNKAILEFKEMKNHA
ncbi:hypothetical protein GMB86_11880 [Terrilactibacillus sp. BCM23-1]|uniref:Uncharacterized protein n=1 Tax=Terrilactibacillus tamarindi TaxID=2599694 RepID=A0A6N8CW35_9BACI|nr:hypothetical protein [Terrilactibacillus tamarindi]MTT32706.1 hypothetical protein [Terrilactibacillus tamarindi]